jgi:hypothetical protein
MHSTRFKTKKPKFLNPVYKLKTRKFGCYFIVIKIKEKRRCQFKNNISSYCRSSPSSGQEIINNGCLALAWKRPVALTSS